MNQSLETIATFSFAPEMGLVRSKLESEGIECFVKDELVSQTYINNAVGGMKLQVKNEDAERAKKIVEEMGVFDKPKDKPSGMSSFDRATMGMPLFGALSLIVRFFAVLVLIAVALSLVYVLVVL
jgi:hypothetical protein